MLIKLELDVPTHKEGKEEQITEIIQRIIDDNWIRIKNELNKDE
jgi:hypothetical protein